MSFSPDVVLRPYAPDDEAGWLRCRLLSFFATCYYDDVHTSRGVFELPSVQLVAAVGDQIAGQIVGLVDVEIDGAAATIDCIAVHPDYQRAGIGARLLEAAFEVLPDTVTTLDAWTREDEGALAWYARHGFTERFRYLHVYKGYAEGTAEFVAPAPLRPPTIAFCHAGIGHEAELRASYARVYVCRQFLREL